MHIADKLKTLDKSKGKDHTDEFWAIIRALAMLDWMCRTGAPPPEFERRFEQIMKNCRVLADTILLEQGLTPEETVVH